MGVKGFFKFIKQYLTNTNFDYLKGKKIGIYGNLWIH